MNIIIPFPNDPPVLHHPDSKTKSVKELRIRNNLTLMGIDYDICSKLCSFQNNETMKYEDKVSLIIDEFFSKITPLDSHEVKFENFNFVPEKEENIIELPNNANNNLKNCPICYEDLPLEEFYTIPSSKHQFCEQCMDFYLTESIYSGLNVLRIQCPDDCGYVLQDHDIKEYYISTSKNYLEMYTKYEEMKNKASLNNNPNYHCCIRRDCENFILNENTGKKLNCDKCGLIFCAECELNWHEGQSCQEALSQYYQVCISLAKRDKNNQEREKSRKNRLFRLRMVNFVLVIPLIVLVLMPITLIFEGFYVPFMIYLGKSSKRWNCVKYLKTILIIFLIIVLMPITIILIILKVCANWDQATYRIYVFYQQYLSCC